MENNFMNLPVQHNITEEDVIAEYGKCNDVKKVAKIFDVTVQEVKDVLKTAK